jgi:serine/threonine protein kinase
MNYLQPSTTLQGGKYRIERVLGQGGFGITYLAEQVSAHKCVAIKELFIANQGQAINGRNGNKVTVTNVSNQLVFDKHREKLKKEASRLATLRHKNLVRVYEWFEENGTVYYVMDFIEGESLRDKLNREGALPESLVMNYLHQLLSALQVVHEKNIWHLDIKPENIMVNRNNHVYLIDFGASKHIEQSNGTLTTSSMLAYTPGYFPPEQSAVTMRNIGAWTDIYALGATLYNLLTRRNPPTFDVIISEGRYAFSFPSSISSKTQDLIVQMMKVNRNERPQSVSQIIAIIDKEVRTISDNRKGGNLHGDEWIKTKEDKTIGDYFYAIIMALIQTVLTGGMVFLALMLAIVVLRSIFHFGDASAFVYPIMILVLFILFIHFVLQNFHEER